MLVYLLISLTVVQASAPYNVSLTQTLQQALSLRTQCRSSDIGVITNDVARNTFAVLDYPSFHNIAEQMKWNAQITSIDQKRNGTTKDEIIIQMSEYNIGYKGSKKTSAAMKILDPTDRRIPSPSMGILITCTQPNANKYALLAVKAVRYVLTRWGGLEECSATQQKPPIEIRNMSSSIDNSIHRIVNHRTTQSLFRMNTSFIPHCHRGYFVYDPNVSKLLATVRGSIQLVHLVTRNDHPMHFFKNVTPSSPELHPFSLVKNIRQCQCSDLSSFTLRQWIGGQYDLRHSNIRSALHHQLLQMSSNGGERIDKKKDLNVIQIKYKLKNNSKKEKIGITIENSTEVVLQLTRTFINGDVPFFDVTLQNASTLDILSNDLLNSIYVKVVQSISPSTLEITTDPSMTNTVAIISEATMRAVVELMWIRQINDREKMYTDGSNPMHLLNQSFNQWKASETIQSDTFNKLLTKSFDEANSNAKEVLENCVMCPRRVQHKWLKQIMEHYNQRSNRSDTATIMTIRRIKA